MEAAVEMAFEDINADPAVLPGHALERHRLVKDSLCQAGEGIKGLIEWINDKSTPIVGVLGADDPRLGDATRVGENGAHERNNPDHEDAVEHKF